MHPSLIKICIYFYFEEDIVFVLAILVSEIIAQVNDFSIYFLTVFQIIMVQYSHQKESQMSESD